MYTIPVIKKNPPPSSPLYLVPAAEVLLCFDRYMVERPPFFPDAVREPSVTPVGQHIPPIGGAKYGTAGPGATSSGLRHHRDVLVVSSPRDSGPHVAPTSLDVYEFVIRAFSKEGDLVCDPFAGRCVV